MSARPDWCKSPEWVAAASAVCDPPLGCDIETFRAFAKSLSEGEKVVELGVSGMQGHTGTVVFTERGVGVRWDTEFVEGSGMVTSITGGTRRYKRLPGIRNFCRLTVHTWGIPFVCGVAGGVLIPRIYDPGSMSLVEALYRSVIGASIPVVVGLGLVLSWRFCRWLRRKQVDGDLPESTVGPRQYDPYGNIAEAQRIVDEFRRGEIQ